MKKLTSIRSWGLDVDSALTNARMLYARLLGTYSKENREYREFEDFPMLLDHFNSTRFVSCLNAYNTTDWEYVLPTEAEWVYAATAGKGISQTHEEIRKFRTEELSSLMNCVVFEESTKQPTTVGQFNANEWGFYDMYGNVWEWTAEKYAPFTTRRKKDPTGSRFGPNVFLGGDWNTLLYDTLYLRGTYRLTLELRREYKFYSSSNFERDSSDFPRIGLRLAYKEK